MADLEFPPSSSSPWTDPNNQTWVHDGDGWIPEESVNFLGGFKNAIINGDFRVNQRGFDGNWAGLSLNDFGYDRWYKFSSISIEQRIENLNLVDGGTYILTHNGTGDGHITDSAGGNSVGGSGLTRVNLDASGTSVDYCIVGVPPDATWAQFERGDVPTAFEVRSFGLEMSLCERYYFESYGNIYAQMLNGNDLLRSMTVYFPQRMRVEPITSYNIANGSYNTGAINPERENIILDAVGTNNWVSITGYKADAEL